VKANESEVFNRVVNRTLYSKKIVMAVLLATIMVGSAFVVTMRGLATNPNDNPTVQGWNLEPWVGWTTGNVKRYLEGEVVPINVTIPNPDASDGVCDRQIEIALDYYYESPGKPKYYGFETAVSYKWGVDDPSAPFEAGSGDQFSVPDTTQGTVKSVTGPALVTGGQETKQVWTVTVTFADGAPVMYLKTGGLLALSTGTIHGASWYPGASLHFALENEGRRTVSVFVDGALAPPRLIVEKSCTPDHVAENDFMTIQLIVENLGQADAKNVVVVDKLPMILWDANPADDVPASWVDLVQYVDGSTWYKTSETPVPARWDDPATQIEEEDAGGNHFNVLTWNGYPLVDDTHRGTGAGGSLRILVVTIWFQVSVVNPGERNVMYTNYAEIRYDDGHLGTYDPACDNAPFWVIQPAILITKRAFMRYDQKETSIHCAAAPYNSGYPLEDGLGLGDWITFEITVSNPSLDWDVDQFWVTDAAIAAQQPDYNGDDVIWYADADIPHAWLDGDGHLHMNGFTAYFNYQITGSEVEVPWPAQGSNPVWVNHANVLAKDVGEKHFAESGADWDIDILHPDASITKTADREIVANHVGITETITYTFTVQNLGDTDLWFAICDPMFATDPSYWPGCANSFAGNLEDPAPLLPYYDPWGIPNPDGPPSWEITRTYVYTYIPPIVLRPEAGGPPDPIIILPPETVDNTVELCAWDQQGHPLLRTDTETVDVVKPDITIDKMAIVPPDPAGSIPEVPVEKDWVGVDGKIYYYFTISNPSPDATMYFMCFDNLLKPYTDNTDPAQSLWGIESLLSGAHLHHVWMLDLTTHIPPITTDIVHNQVDVYAWWNPEHPDNRIHDFATYDVKRTAKISGHVYHDINYDAKWNTLTEEGLGDFTVELWNSAQTLKLGTRYSATGGDVGYYEFASILPGTYWVKEIPLSGYFITNGTWHQVSVVGGDSKKQDIGNQQFSSIWNWKWYDWNMGGSWDDSEVGINGWTIQITWKSGPFEPPVDQKVRTTLTTTAPFILPGDPAPRDGYWAFADVYPGVYKVEELYDALLWKPTTGGTVFTGVPPVGHMTPGVYDDTEFAPGQQVICTKFGNVPLTTVTGYKFYDKDMDGIWDPGEPALNGVKITLNKWCNEHQAYEEVQRTAAPLGSDGKYVFTGVTPGDYKIGEVFPASFPYGSAADWYCTNPNSLTFSIGHILGPQVNPGIAGPDMGNMRYAKVRGYMFEDLFGPGGAWPNGRYDTASEHGFVGPGYQVILSGMKATHVPSPFSVTVRTWPEDGMAEGNYKICQLVPGEYTVKVFSGPGAGYWATTPIEYKIVIPAYFGGDAPVVFDQLNFGYVLKDRTKDPELPFALQAGWNLWSTPMDVPGLTASGLLSAIGPNGWMITKLNEATGVYDTYISGDDPWYDFPIVLGEGYYIYATDYTLFRLSGQWSDSNQIQLVAGWNIVGHNQLHCIKASELLGMVTGCNPLMVTALDAETGIYNTYIIGDEPWYDFYLIPGGAYYLWVDGPGQIVYT